MIEYALVPGHEVAGEIAPNITRHYDEMLPEEKDKDAPNIDWQGYLAASHGGSCFVLTARDGVNLVGYSVYTIGTNPRHKEVIEAVGNGMFVEREYRGKVNLLKKADELLKAAGVHETSYIIKSDRVGKLLGRNGYKPEYKLWSLKYV